MERATVAVITPSYAPDFELCKTLNRSILEFLPPPLRHYIFVDRRDFRLFASLQGERTVVLPKQEILPRGVRQLPFGNRWVCGANPMPISGWLVQQIAKIAAAHVLREDVLLMVDSDATFVRDVAVPMFASAGRTRLYRGRGVISAAMPAHVEWYNAACKLLDVPTDPLPVDDYIGQVISWDRRLVLEMCARIEAVTGRTWHSALAATRNVSEYLLYGVFVAKVAGEERVWIDHEHRCTTHWDASPLARASLEEFAHSLGDGDIALMISSHSRTPASIRSAVLSIATNGRLN
jgi:hypothetical protein